MAGPVVVGVRGGAGGARAGHFGRVPVTATVDGMTWSTSVWRGRDSGWLLAVPARVRRGKDDGATVLVAIAVDASRL